MAGRFMHCAGRTKLTEGQADVLKRADPQTPVDHSGTSRQISEAVTFDGRYISVFEAPCFGCHGRMVQVRILDPKQARPPQDLGASVSMWSFLSPEVPR